MKRISFLKRSIATIVDISLFVISLRVFFFNIVLDGKANDFEDELALSFQQQGLDGDSLEMAKTMIPDLSLLNEATLFYYTYIPSLYEILILFAFFVFMWFFTSGRSLGLYIVGARIVHDDESSLTLKRSFLKAWHFLLSSLITMGINNFPFYEGFSRTYAEIKSSTITVED